MEPIFRNVDDAQSVRENLLSRIDRIIDEELARADDGPMLLLRIETVLCVDHDERPCDHAGGWVTLAFAGAGLYRYCKYRIGFDQRSMSQLRRLRKRFEVAAGTLHPEWHKLLSVIGVSPDHEYHGHPSDWVVQDDGDPIPLAATYQHQPGPFIYRQITESIIDQDAWGETDPRRISHRSPYTCVVCGCIQSDDPSMNQCTCFPDLYGDKTRPRAVQVFRTKDGRNNGADTPSPASPSNAAPLSANSSALSPPAYPASTSWKVESATGATRSGKGARETSRASSTIPVRRTANSRSSHGWGSRG
ncbi:MAG: hypothetical protein Q9177_005714 [Variospora cf. flavescens]